MSLLEHSLVPVDFEQWLRDKKNLSENTIYYYVKTVENFLVEEKNPDVIESYNNYIIAHGIKKRSSYVYSVLKTFAKFYFKEASDRNHIIENLITPDVQRNIKRERKNLDEYTIMKIINGMESKKHRIVALIQHLTGARAGDVLRTPRGNIQPELYRGKPVIKIILEGKGRKRNVVYIHDDASQEFIINWVVKNIVSLDYYFLNTEIIRVKDLAFRQHRIEKSNHQAYYRDLKETMAKVGVEYKDFATHDYRRSFARRVWEKYKDVHVLQELLNHENPATTMRYLKQSGLKNIDYHEQMQQ